MIDFRVSADNRCDNGALELLGGELPGKNLLILVIAFGAGDKEAVVFCVGIFFHAYGNGSIKGVVQLADQEADASISGPSLQPPGLTLRLKIERPYN